MTKILLALMLCLCLVGCTSADILNDINLALNAAEALLPILLPLINGAAGGSPVISTARAAEIASWVNAGAASLSAYSKCKSAGGTNADLGLCATKNFASIVANVPDMAGLPENIANNVEAMATNIQAILDQYSNVPTMSESQRAASVAKVGAKEKDQLDSYRARADVIHDKLSAALGK